MQFFELSVVIPCLNEAETLEACIRKAYEGMESAGIHGEVIVADNGSTDESPEIAVRSGARLGRVVEKGYGHALMAGIGLARGRFIIMGDADDSYDFREIPKFVLKLREGYELVQGCRLPAGGGRIMPGAMPFLHRWLGNPGLSLMVRCMFGAPVHDVYCGLRGFSREMYERLNQRCTGMEFATEMIIKASLLGERIEEVPITLYPDRRRSHRPHLRTFRDGLRTLRFFLIYSPRWLFLIPGLSLVILGILGYGIALPGLAFGGISFDAHTLLFASLFLMLGYQSVLFAILSKTFAVTEGLLPPDRTLERFYSIVDLEKGIVVSLIALVAGLGLLVIAMLDWRASGFGDLDYAVTMRRVIPGVTLAALGFQTLLFGFFASMLGMRRR